MGWMTLTYSCGHEDRQQLYGPMDERRRRVEYLERGVCTACYRAQQTDRSKATTARLSLPTLTGSERQVAWAEQLRADRVAQIERLLADAKGLTLAEGIAQMETEDTDAARTTLASLRAVLGMTEAHWWIERRGEPLRTALTLARGVAT